MDTQEITFTDLGLSKDETFIVEAVCRGVTKAEIAKQLGWEYQRVVRTLRRTQIKEALARVRQAALPPEPTPDPDTAARNAVLSMQRSMDLLTEIAEKSIDDHARIKAIQAAMNLSGAAAANQMEDVAKGIKILMGGVKKRGRAASR